MRTEDLANFIIDRHRIYLRKQAGMPKPWTDDPILQSYRFCNVYRELDTQTQWFARNWRDPHAEDPHLWFASLVFRSINWYETAEELGYPVPWDPKKFVKVLRERGARGEKVYSGAYMISTHGAKVPKYWYLAESLHAIWKVREKVRYYQGTCLEPFHDRLKDCFDVGSFMAAQVVADCKYTRRYDAARDWFTFAASGPGSRRGLNRVMGHPVKKPWLEPVWQAKLASLYSEIKPIIRSVEMPHLHAQDLQNCLCEFDKYERVRLGEGKPKQKYNGGSE